MEELAPETVGVAAGLGAARQVALGGHVAVVRTLAARGVLIAVTDVEDLQGRVGKRLTAWAPGTGNDRTIGRGLAHRRGPFGTGRRRSCAATLPHSTISSEKNIAPHNRSPRTPCWPKTNRRRRWTWLTRPLADRARRNIPPPRSARWCSGHHLPGMFRAEFGWDLYTRMCVPVAEHLTRVWYYHCTRPRNAWRRLWDRVAYATIRRWIIEYNFSRQDETVMLRQRYDTPEKRSGTDAEVIQWRRLVVTKHFGGRGAAFEYKNPDGLSPDAVPLSRVSVRYVQEHARARGARGRHERSATRPPTVPRDGGGRRGPRLARRGEHPGLGADRGGGEEGRRGGRQHLPGRRLQARAEGLRRS